MKKKLTEYLYSKSSRRARFLAVSLVAVFAIAFSGYYISVVSPARANAFDGQGTGSVDDPYQVTDCAQLQAIDKSPTAQYVLVNDIDCADTVNWNNGEGFKPLVNFSARLDGRNYEIRDLYINRPEERLVGLFEAMSGEIINLKLTKSVANASRIDINGANEVGGAIGRAESGARIKNVSSSLNVQADGIVDGNNNRYATVGGLIGLFQGNEVYMSSSSGNVSVSQTQSLAIAMDIGGLIGNAYFAEQGSSYISNSFATGSVDGTNIATAPAGYCGGFIGTAGTNTDVPIVVKIEHSYSTGSVACETPLGAPGMGGFVGLFSIGRANNVADFEVKNNFTTSLVIGVEQRANIGFFDTINEPVYEPGANSNGIDFRSNYFDAFRTGRSGCGADNTGVRTCNAANVGNAQPNFFTGSDYYVSTDPQWDITSVWESGSSLPTLRTLPVQPDAPFNVRLSREPNDAVKVEWDFIDSANSRSSNIVNFEVWIADANEGNGNDYNNYQTLAASSDRELIIDGLTLPGTYSFKVRAIMDDSILRYSSTEGLFSDEQSSGFGMPEDAPQNIVLTPKSKSVEIAFPPVNTATGYRVEYRKAGADSWLGSLIVDTTPVLGQVKKLQLGLEPQAQYEFRLLAKNAGGDGPWSDLVGSTTLAVQQYTIANCQQLQDINNDPEGGYTLSQDIDCATQNDFTPIPLFTGTLNGNGKTISNLTIYKEYVIPESDQNIHVLGIFGVAADVSIQNLTIRNSSFVADYILPEAVDEDQNGLPDAPVVDAFDIDEIGVEEVPGSGQEALSEAQRVAEEVALQVQDAGQQLLSQIPGAGLNFPKIGAGSLAGVVVGGGNYSNIKVLNSTVSSGVAGGVFGAILPIDGIANLPDLNAADVGAIAWSPMTLSGLQTSGLVSGIVAGGLFGVASSSVNSLFSEPGATTIVDSSSAMEVQANVGGGLVGAAISLTVGQPVIKGTSLGAQQEAVFPNQEFLDALFQSLGSQDFIIKNSFSTGLVSSCQAASALRVAVLGGLVGVGAGTSIESSRSTGNVTTCSNTPSNWGIYGGFMGGLAGVMVSSRVTDSYATGNIEGIENSATDQYSPGIFIGATGGLVGFNLTLADDADGRFAINRSYNTGDTIISGKQGLVAVSGGLTGIHIGTATVKDSYNTGRVVHVSPDKNIFTLSSIGGISGMNFGVDSTSILRTAWGWPNVAAPTHGIDIVNSYNSGDIIIDKNKQGGNLGVSGGLVGLMIGQGKVQSSHSTAKVTSNLPDDVRLKKEDFQSVANVDNEDFFSNDFDGPGAIFGDLAFNVGVQILPRLGGSQYGATVSGGLVGSAYGLDVSGLIMLGASAASTNNQDQVFAKTTGIVVDDSYAKGEVKGTLVGGLFGSADLNVAVSKTYSESNVEGSIVGGLIGQSGLTNVAANTAIYTLFAYLTINAEEEAQNGNTDPIDSMPDLSETLNLSNDMIGTPVITNTYTTGKLTGTPGYAALVGKTRILDKDLEEISAPGPLPTTVGGLIGISMAPSRSISNSYASGDIVIEQDPAFNPDPNWPLKLPKIPSFAGGIIGIDISLPVIDVKKSYQIVSDANGDPVQPVDTFLKSIPNTENVFTASKLQLSNSTITGGGTGLFIAPAPFINRFLLGQTSESLPIDAYARFSNVFVDRTRISVSNCGGPNNMLSDEARDLLDQTKKLTESGQEDLFSLDDRNAVVETAETYVDPFIAKPACEFVNQNNSDPRYFIQNKVNTPMNQWNFASVWKVVQDDYPKFVGGVSTSNPGGPTPPGGTGTSTNVVPPTVPQPVNDTPIREVSRTIATRLGFAGGVEQVKGLKAFLASIPLFLARSIPYSIVLLLLLLAALYSRQALKEYRQLKGYHESVSRMVNTKTSVDNFLAITTHYLNTPVAIMNGAVELMTSLKKISSNKGLTITNKIKKLADGSAALLVANQVSSAASSNDEKIVQRTQPSPYKSKSVWIPASIAFVLIVVANAMFIYAEVFNSSPYRLAIEFGLYALAVFLIALAYRYRNFFEETKKITMRQLELETDLYGKRLAFIPDAVKVIGEHYESIKLSSESIKDMPEAKLFFNGLNMLGGMYQSLGNIQKFASVNGDTPLFDVTAYLQRTLHTANTTYKDKGVTFDANINPGIAMHIRPEEIKHLVESVIDNAAKFSKEGGNVQVAMFKRFNKIVLSVSDQGVGISEQKLPSLLKPFVRGTESMQYNYEGIGLGLYTSKVILDKLGGTISIRSKLGTGTLVTITLPAKNTAGEVATVMVMPEQTATT